MRNTVPVTRPKKQPLQSANKLQSPSESVFIVKYWSKILALPAKSFDEVVQGDCPLLIEHSSPPNVSECYPTYHLVSVISSGSLPL